MSTLFINGKFAAQRLTGVQRVAHNLLRALDARLAVDTASLSGPVMLLLPPGIQVSGLRRIQRSTVGRRSVPLHAWEQCLLPHAARSGLLLNLAGSAPLLARHQVCLVHDAAVYDCPQAYSLQFRYWYRALFWLLPRWGAQLLTVSAYSRQRLATRLGIPLSRIGVVANGGDHLRGVEPDPTVLTRHRLESGRYFLAVGSDNPNKNFDRLRAAFAALQRRQGIQLVIVGVADRRVFARQECGVARPEVGVVSVGSLDDSALKALYQHAIGLVFPSLYEGFGLPPLEAMSCGCPVTAASAAAIPEVCGDAALYFEPGSVEQITAAMQRLLDDAALRDSLCQRGADRVRGFNWDRAAQTLQAQLSMALAGDDARP